MLVFYNPDVGIKNCANASEEISKSRERSKYGLKRKLLGTNSLDNYLFDGVVLWISTQGVRVSISASHKNVSPFDS